MGDKYVYHTSLYILAFIMTLISFRPSHLELTEADIHSEISETARKIADLESNFDENEEVITPSHLDRMHDLVIPYDQTDKVMLFNAFDDK